MDRVSTKRTHVRLMRPEAGYQRGRLLHRRRELGVFVGVGVHRNGLMNAIRGGVGGGLDPSERKAEGKGWVVVVVLVVGREKGCCYSYKLIKETPFVTRRIERKLETKARH